MNAIADNQNATDSSSINSVALKREATRFFALIHVLDKLILYLRIVYSVDFYACVKYSSESDMPYPCGMIHVRGADLSGTDTTDLVDQLNDVLTADSDEEVRNYVRIKASLNQYTPYQVDCYLKAFNKI